MKTEQRSALTLFHLKVLKVLDFFKVDGVESGLEVSEMWLAEKVVEKIQH